MELDTNYSQTGPFTGEQFAQIFFLTIKSGTLCGCVFLVYK